MRTLAVLSTIGVLSGCMSEPVTARVENISSSEASIDVTLSVSERLEGMLGGQDFFSKGGVLLEDSRSGRWVLPEQTVQIHDERGGARFTAQFRCPLIAVGQHQAEEVASLAGYELVVLWNAHMFIGSRGSIRMSLPNDIACQVGEANQP